MKNHIAIFLLIALAIIASAEFTVLVTTVSPFTADREALWAFFVSLFFASASWLSLIWYFFKKNVLFRLWKPSLWVAVRQASLLCLIIVLSFFFKSLGILSIWDIIPLSVSAVLIEFFFQADKSPIEPLSHELS